MLLSFGCTRQATEITIILSPKKLDQNLDPISIPYTNDFYLLDNLTAKLLNLDERGNYQHELASNIEKINPRTYAISIKETFFSNGEKITLEDLKQSFLRSLRLGSSHGDFKKLVKDIRIESGRLFIELYQPSHIFYHYLSLPDFGVLHKSQYQKSQLQASDYAISSGAFSYSCDKNNFYLLRNKYFRLGQIDYPAKVKLIAYFSDTSIGMLLKNQVDVGKIGVSQLLKHYKSITGNKNLKILGSPSSSLTYLFFNPASKKFSENEKKRIKKIILDKFDVPKEFSWIAKKTSQYFPQQSKAYLSENELIESLKTFSSFDSSGINKEITVHTYTTAYNVTLEPLVKRLERIQNIKVRILPVVPPEDFETWRDQGRFDLFLNIMSNDSRIPLETINYEFFSKEGALKDRNKLVEDSFKRYQKSFSEKDRINELKKISKFIVEGSQVIPLFNSAIPYVYNNGTLNLRGLNHIFIFNLWKIEKINSHLIMLQKFQNFFAN